MVLLSPYIDQVILLSGDGDFTYAVQVVRRRGVRVTVVSTEPTEEGNRTSRRLIEAADEFVNLKDVLEEVKRPSRDLLAHVTKVIEPTQGTKPNGNGAKPMPVGPQAM